MKKPCKECPHFIRNRHNDMIVDFADRTGKKHNCHMTEEKKSILDWDLHQKLMEKKYGKRKIQTEYKFKR
jgi:hypothetical protein